MHDSIVGAFKMKKSIARLERSVVQLGYRTIADKLNEAWLLAENQVVAEIGSRLGVSGSTARKVMELMDQVAPLL